MKKTENIINLIQSLSKSEKRYFKLFVAKNSKGESNHFIKLFDIIDKLGTAEKNTIRKFYGDEKFMKGLFRLYKIRLYDQILNSLSAYHSEQLIDDKILQSIRKAKILYDKFLYSDAEKIFAKAKIMASKYEKHTLLLEINYWQKKIISTPSAELESYKEAKINQLIEEEKLTINKIENNTVFWKQKALIFNIYMSKGIARVQEDIDQYNSIINAPVLRNQMMLSYDAKSNFYAMYTTYFFATHNLNEAYKYAKKAIELNDTHPYQIESNPWGYSTILHNFLLITHRLKKHEEFFSMLSKLKSLLQKFKPPLPMKIRFYNLEFTAYLDIGHFKKAARLLSIVETTLADQKNMPEGAKIIFVLDKSLLYFFIKEYHKALIGLNEILNNEKSYLAQDRYTFAKLLQLIIHFEKGNMDFLPHLLKSLYKYLIQKKKLYKIENLLIQFVRTILAIKSNKEQIEVFKTFKKELTSIYNDPLEANFLNFFDAVSWLESKIENRPFEEILREKSGYSLEEEND